MGSESIATSHSFIMTENEERLALKNACEVKQRPLINFASWRLPSELPPMLSHGRHDH
jgi:hypothetical protein